jgi:hypothetical protein
MPTDCDGSPGCCCGCCLLAEPDHDGACGCLDCQRDRELADAELDRLTVEQLRADLA